ncbi:OLC1v1016718C1 [Oldenlandia corymbosa var. corymbosa]|uniref:OLC1v1016718C1 n=1 Tax=Oldenlandia corymbosa var. corymbosa TaxID=529605 RepID=A0AAV1E7S1_OLDCO|nr:OLC1v1016718C1 [Oldenlandia corymbosa var. corymbosa]
MGSQFNFKNFGNDPNDGSGKNGGGRPPGNVPLARQSSVYSLTFDEFQNTIGGSGKDFGSMNMDELLKNIWSAEEIQSTGSAAGVAATDLAGSSGYLQRQGSLTLPRTLSQKTVDEVWRDMSKEFNFSGGKDNNSIAYSNVPQAQRQPTLGEMTLEEFLVRAGVVREDAQLYGNTAGIFDDLSRVANNQALGFGFPQPGMNTGLTNGRILESSNQIGMNASNLPLNVNGVRTAQQQLGTAQTVQTNQTQPLSQPQHQQQQQPPLFPKQPGMDYGAPSVGIRSAGQLSSPGMRGGIVGDLTAGGNMVQNGGLPGAGMGMVGVGGAGVTIAAVSPGVSSDGLGKSNGDTSSVSPVPYVFNGGMRGRKSTALEKVVERRQRRMIKNRESAARSRARKQVCIS